MIVRGRIQPARTACARGGPESGLALLQRPGIRLPRDDAAAAGDDKCCELVCDDKLDTETASMAKYWCSDLQCKVMDECVQLFGGYGYMWEYPITRAYADARVQRIYGGTNEIMKEVISRGMGLRG